MLVPHLVFLRRNAFAGETNLIEDLIRHYPCSAHNYGCNFLSFVLDPADPAVPLLAKYKTIRVTNHICK